MRTEGVATTRCRIKTFFMTGPRVSGVGATLRRRARFDEEPWGHNGCPLCGTGVEDSLGTPLACNPRGLVEGHTTRCPRLDTSLLPIVSDQTALRRGKGVAPLHPPPGSPWTGWGYFARISAPETRTRTVSRSLAAGVSRGTHHRLDLRRLRNDIATVELYSRRQKAVNRSPCARSALGMTLTLRPAPGTVVDPLPRLTDPPRRATPRRTIDAGGCRRAPY